MSEQTSSDDGHLMKGSKKITIRVTVEGEDNRYDIAKFLPQELVDVAEVDMVDTELAYMMNKLRAKRQLVVHGECTREGCTRPKLVQSPESASFGACGPHAWEADQAARAERFTLD